MKILFVIAIVLLLPSFFTIGQMIRETIVGDRVYSRLHVEGEYLNLSPTWKGHVISLTDTARSTDPTAKVILPWGHVERLGRVTITIDGKDISWPHDVAIRPESKGILNRYHHWIFIGRLNDRQKVGEEFVIVQRFIEDGKDNYRVLRLSENGHVNQEIFAHSERTNPVERTFFVRLVYPTGIGFNSNVLQVWPSLIYPIAYPAGTGLVGCGLLLVLSWKWWRGRNRGRMPEPVSAASPALTEFAADAGRGERRFVRRVSIALGLSLLALATVAVLFFGNGVFWNKGVNERIVVPDGYRGFVGVFYERAHAQKLPLQGGWLHIEFPEDGIIFTSSKLNVGWKRIEFCERSGGRLIPIPPHRNSELKAAVSSTERIFTGGSTHSMNGSPPVVVYFVGDAADRAKLDWQSTTRWIEAAVETKR